jgi:hypothetical protein
MQARLDGEAMQEAFGQLTHTPPDPLHATAYLQERLAARGEGER